MKHLTSLLFIIALSFTGISQDYMDKIAQKACGCVEELDENMDKEMYTMKMGLCIVSATNSYEKQIKKDYKIDLTENLDQAEKLGEIIGMRMASVCPETLIKMSTMFMDEEEYVEEEFLGDDPIDEAEYMKGVVIKIEEEGFVTFSVKDENGKTEKFYWLDFVDSDFDFMADYKTLMGQKVYFFYESRELFDPRISEYREVKVLRYIEMDEE